ncbi:precorrin-2 C(20)-methyltransferase [Rhodothalassium salexigens]|uniref:precorrin-2 C(20)-methyltransferase n=1 Tax=Rhodothalassium salexigens TaxID=1086 RepID=UPI0019138753|nr:precorrin-2 C(20)-methyltransferase [Rhodothalassium salexigens]MBK5911261.1 precorrin-2 C(20)-methyltransferase [Rhodothalassium salexigens]MBK5920246.1 precorrin-2 C(20)-methyltransferase [Rhodothalassium salexigens]
MGTLYGLGLGPGDPDLMTVRAARLLAAAGHVAFFRKAGRPGRARAIVEGLLPPGAVELAMEYPVTTEIPVTDPRYNAMLSGFYARWAGQLGALVEAGRDVVVLCEGDPFFYGSFMHLHARLKDRARVEVVPGITAMSAAWTASGQPVTWGDDVLTVLPGTLDEERLTAGIAQADAVVVMKLGCHLDRVRRAFDRAGRGDDAWLVQCATLPEQRVVPLRAYEGRSTPYFSIVVAHGRGRRP